MRYRNMNSPRFPSSPRGSISSPHYLTRGNINSPISPTQDVPSLKWHTYSQTLLERGAVSNFGVYALKKFREWTSTPDFHVSKEEVDAIVAGFTDDIHLRMRGIQLQGVTFTLTRMSWNHVMMLGRSSATGSGCVIYLCRTCILIATHDEGPQTSLCYNAVEKLGDFLIEQGF